MPLPALRWATGVWQAAHPRAGGYVQSQRIVECADYGLDALTGHETREAGLRGIDPTGWDFLAVEGVAHRLQDLLICVHRSAHHGDARSARVGRVGQSHGCLERGKRVLCAERLLFRLAWFLNRYGVRCLPPLTKHSIGVHGTYQQPVLTWKEWSGMRISGVRSRLVEFPLDAPFRPAWGRGRVQ